MQKHFAWVGCEINRIITTGKESTRWIPSAFSGGIYSEGLDFHSTGLGGSRVKYPPCLAEEPGRNEDVFLPSLCTSMVVNNLFVAFSRIEMEEQQLREIKLVNGVDAFDQWKQAAKWKDSLMGSPFFNISQKILYSNFHHFLNVNEKNMEIL